jgi:formylglycine-generating enzyme required for sulfatase activity
MLGFVEVPPGPFLMGSEKSCDPLAYNNELPQHAIILATYYIARNPVTMAQFWAFVQATRYERMARATVRWHSDIALFDELRARQPLDGDERLLPDHPVVGVTWYEALEYCDWLTKYLREWEGTPEPLASRLRQEGWRVTLPSEPEWEKAARGTDGRIYPWGSDFDTTRVNCAEATKSTGGTTSAVGSFPSGASPYAVEDISGNVWEWTRSIWGAYPYPADERGRVGRENLEVTGDALRTVRGGAFFVNPRSVRCAARMRKKPTDCYGGVGFRVVACPSL